MDESQRELVRQELRRKQSEIWDPYDSPTPELFHFTSPQGLRGIIENHQLWCSDVAHVNDPREGDYGLSVLKSVLKRKSVYKWFKEPILSSDTLSGMKAQWTSYMSGRRWRTCALTTVRRSNCTCSFPAYSFYEGLRFRDAIEGINRIKLTSPYSPYSLVSGNCRQPPFRHRLNRCDRMRRTIQPSSQWKSVRTWARL